jgi:hypothetical protein
MAASPRVRNLLSYRDGAAYGVKHKGSHMTENFTPKQLEALDLLKRKYPSGVGIKEEWARIIFDSLIERGTGLVELVDTDETPTGDAYVLTDAGADAFRDNAEDASRVAGSN